MTARGLLEILPWVCHISQLERSGGKGKIKKILDIPIVKTEMNNGMT